jgi:phage terminase large subunit-like protein
MPFSEERAAKTVGFIQNRCRHTRGEYAGRRFKLAPWQRDGIIRPLFGTVNEHGLRQYRTAFVSRARKNGKSEEGTALALYLLCGDGERGAEVYSAAGDREQAAIVFNTAAQMVRLDPVLSKRCRVIDSTKRILYEDRVYRALSAEAYSKHGFNCHGIVFDELHTQANRELWDVLTTGTRGRRQPLTYAITTAGYNRNSICYEIYDYAKQVLNGTVVDPSFFAYLSEVPENADWRDESLWKLANPGLGTREQIEKGEAFLDIEALRSDARKAEYVPAYQNTFRQLSLNQWVQQNSRWLDLAAWDACDTPLSELAGRECYAGLDLSSTTDITALVLAFKDKAGAIDILPFFWIPGDNMRERANRDRVSYPSWVAQGLVQSTEGNVIHYAAILKKLEELKKIYNVREVAFDRWGATKLSQDLTGAGFKMVEFGQGYASMSAPMKELLTLILSKRIRHGGNPVLRWMADCMEVKQDPARNIKPAKPDRGRSGKRIDGIVALVMAIDLITRNQKKPSVYETRGFLFV